MMRAYMGSTSSMGTVTLWGGRQELILLPGRLAADPAGRRSWCCAWLSSSRVGDKLKPAPGLACWHRFKLVGRYVVSRQQSPQPPDLGRWACGVGLKTARWRSRRLAVFAWLRRSGPGGAGQPAGELGPRV